MVQVQSGPVSVWAGSGINRVETPKGGFLLHQGGILGFTCTAGVSLRTGAVVAVMANDAAVVPDNVFSGWRLRPPNGSPRHSPNLPSRAGGAVQARQRATKSPGRCGPGLGRGLLD